MSAVEKYSIRYCLINENKIALKFEIFVLEICK